MEHDDHSQYAEDKARTLYTKEHAIHCPYFQEKVVLSADGFHHLRFSARRERTKDEQRLKFRLLPLALQVIRKSGTVQEYRRALMPMGKRRADGFIPVKDVEYWAFVAIVGDISNQIKIKTIVRKVGNGQLTFWSVMPGSKIKNGKQQFAPNDIEDA